jgi:hypothetical protein
MKLAWYRGISKAVLLLGFLITMLLVLIFSIMIVLPTTMPALVNLSVKSK